MTICVEPGEAGLLKLEPEVGLIFLDYLYKIARRCVRGK
jgi:hypothetical protein